MGHGILFLELARHSLDRTKWVLPTNKLSTSRCLLQLANDKSWQHRFFGECQELNPGPMGKKQECHPLCYAAPQKKYCTVK